MHPNNWRKHPVIVLILLAFWTSAQTVSFSLAAVDPQDFSVVTDLTAETVHVSQMASTENKSSTDRTRPCLLTCFAYADICVSQCATSPPKVSVAVRVGIASARLRFHGSPALAGKIVPVEPAPPKTFG
ncbi:hypothetical protein [uncultured Roseibium sp.]|uniref:hypothetical protein n=1 Tax=uncultured Roseibium sp. TaxID=1936171 RepID=UPI00263A14CE|nr:hypothetical protein [uncultured Roseibium sp.]